MNNLLQEDTICALATGGGLSAIAVLRLSGKEAIKITNAVFSKDISASKSHTIHFGTISDSTKIIDEVLVSIFKDGKSYTGEETVEISCHGSTFIQNKLLQLFITEGCRMATAGEFTMRAFRNRKLDLSQAESVADLIASESEAAHQTALKQLRGGFSNKLQELRTKLIDFASLIELELDFSEEDVEFADKKQFETLLTAIKEVKQDLINEQTTNTNIASLTPILEQKRLDLTSSETRFMYGDVSYLVVLDKMLAKQKLEISMLDESRDLSLYRIKLYHDLGGNIWSKANYVEK